MEEQDHHNQLSINDSKKFESMKVMSKGTEDVVVDSMLALVKEHGLTISNINDIHAKLTGHMLNNATIEEG